MTTIKQRIERLEHTQSKGNQEQGLFNAAIQGGIGEALAYVYHCKQTNQLYDPKQKAVWTKIMQLSNEGTPCPT